MEEAGTTTGIWFPADLSMRNYVGACAADQVCKACKKLDSQLATQSHRKTSEYRTV